MAGGADRAIAPPDGMKSRPPRMRSGGRALTYVEASEEGLGLWRRRDAQPGGEGFAAAAVGGLHVGRAAEAVASDHEVLARILGARVHSQGGFVAVSGFLPLSRLLPAEADLNDLPEKPAAEPVGQGPRPGGVRLAVEERPLIELGRPSISTGGSSGTSPRFAIRART